MATPGDRLCGFLHVGVSLESLPVPLGRGISRLELAVTAIDKKDLNAEFKLHLE